MTNPTSKVYTIRNSILIELFKIGHIQTIYNIFAVILFLLIVDDVVTGYVMKEGIVTSYEMVKKGCGKIYISVLGWCLYFFLTCMLYFCFKIWATYRKSLIQKFWDFFFLLLVPAYYTLFFVSATYFVNTFELPIISSGLLLIEIVKLFMKTHSFIRTNTAKVLETKPDAPLPTFCSYFYFLLSPCLLYRDNYPRNEKIDWTFVFFRVLECLAAIIFLCIVVDKTLNPLIQDFGLRQYTPSEIISALIKGIFAGMLILVLFFFFGLHSWLNIVAELTRFGDRYFYDDWWTCTNYNKYYRKWNVYVQDWMYFHVYIDMKNIFCGNSILAKSAVFLISSLLHDWSLGTIFALCAPIITLIFTFFGTILVFTKIPDNAFFNALFLCNYSFWVGIFALVYGVEYYARINVPVVNATVGDYFIPRLLTCGCTCYSFVSCK